MSIRKRYETFVKQNEALVRKLQEVANMLVFLVPGSDLDGELAQEAGLAAINLVVIYHQLLFKAKKKLKLAAQTGRKGGLNAARTAVRAGRTSALEEQSGDEQQMAWEEETLPKEETAPRSALRLALTICAHTEVVAEMVAIRLVGDEQKWPIITLIEAVKSLSRMWLLTKSNGPRKGEGGDTQTLLDLARVQHNGCQYSSTNEQLAGPFSAPPGMMPPSGPSEDSSLVAGPADPAEVMRRTMDYRHRYRRRWSDYATGVGSAQLLRPRLPAPHTVIKIGETLHIMRPLVYALCRWRMGSRRWVPLLVSALMDFLSASCVDIAASIHAFVEGKGDGTNPTATAAITQAIVGRHIWGLMGPLFRVPATPSAFLERHDAALFKLFSFEDRAEFSRRRSMLLYYLLRDPLFDSLTRPTFASVAGVMSYIPLVGSLADYAMFSLEYYQKKHFWFSASSGR
jgi:hypothetical protein